MSQTDPAQGREHNPAAKPVQINPSKTTQLLFYGMRILPTPICCWRISKGQAPPRHRAQILTAPGAPHIAQGEKLKR